MKQGVVRQAINHPSAVLLVVQLLGVLLYPFMEETLLGRGLFEVFGALVLTLAIWSVRDSPTPTGIAVALAVIASALSIVDAVNHSPALQVASAVFHAIFYFAAAASLMVYMLADRKVTTDELYAVGATFTLVAWAFAYLFVILQVAQPGCFIAAVDSDQPRTWMELLFLSFTNLSSTGLSDIVPVTAHARSVVMIEQLAGLAYVALIVSRLVGLTSVPPPQLRRCARGVGSGRARSLINGPRVEPGHRPDHRDRRGLDPGATTAVSDVGHGAAYGLLGWPGRRRPRPQPACPAATRRLTARR